MISDLKIYETGDGGDLLLVNNDIATIEDLSNQPYLAMFGGNVEANTEPDAESDEFSENLDWWGNNLFFPQDSVSQFNSDTERALENNTLTSKGRVVIEQAAISDTKFLNPKDVQAVIPDNDKIMITVQVFENYDFKWTNDI